MQFKSFIIYFTIPVLGSVGFALTTMNGNLDDTGLIMGLIFSQLLWFTIASLFIFTTPQTKKISVKDVPILDRVFSLLVKESYPPLLEKSNQHELMLDQLYQSTLASNRTFRKHIELLLGLSEEHTNLVKALSKEFYLHFGLKEGKAITTSTDHPITSSSNDTHVAYEILDIMNYYLKTALENNNKSIASMQKIDVMINEINHVFALLMRMSKLTTHSNTLANSATIEAARTGRAKRKFRVVVENIQELSKHSQTFNKTLNTHMLDAQKTMDEIRTIVAEFGHYDPAEIQQQQISIKSDLNKLQVINTHLVQEVNEMNTLTAELRQIIDQVEQSEEIKAQLQHQLLAIQTKQNSIKKVIKEVVCLTQDYSSKPISEQRQVNEKLVQLSQKLNLSN